MEFIAHLTILGCVHIAPERCEEISIFNHRCRGWEEGGVMICEGVIK
jgi:hypothetical protein